MINMFINGEYIQSKSTHIDNICNPATGEVVEQVVMSTKDDVRMAVEVAREAFASWSRMPFSQRGEILFKAAHLIKENEKELATSLVKEQGKPMREGMLEIRRFVHTIEHYAGLAKSVRGGYVPLLDKNKYGMIIKKPLGVCGAIVPWNFPVALMGNKIAPGLLAGNTFVVKPANTTPVTATKCIELFQHAGLPKGVLNCVPGTGNEVGEEIVLHPQVAKVGFTGSTPVGKQVMRLAADTVKRVTLELGGSDPMIVCDDADIDRAVSAASVGRFFNCGQACLAIKRLYLFDSIADDFIEKLVEKVKKLRIGNGLTPGTIIGPLHSANQRDEVESQVQDAVDKGARVLIGGSRPDGAEYAKGHFYLPTLVTDVDASSRMLTEEVFGPALPIIRVRDFEEALEKANNSIYGLGSSIWTRDLKRANEAAERLEAGYTWVNSAQTIFDEMPFGGAKQSGLGKEHGDEALDYYMETKSVVMSTD